MFNMLILCISFLLDKGSGHRTRAENSWPFRRRETNAPCLWADEKDSIVINLWAVVDSEEVN